MTFSYPPPDITSQILNFGAPAPLDVQVTGTDHDATEAFALRILREIRKIPGLVDARMQQSSSLPQLQVDADRSRMAQLGLTERDVTNALATSLAGTSQSAPNFWLNPKNGVSYNMTAQTPEYKLDFAGGAAEPARHRPHAAAAPQVLGGLYAHQPQPGQHGGDALQHPAHHRCVRHHPGPRPGRGGQGRAEGDRRQREISAARRHRHPARPGG